jgi:hypothetical protein
MNVDTLPAGAGGITRNGQALPASQWAIDQMDECVEETLRLSGRAKRAIGEELLTPASVALFPEVTQEAGICRLAQWPAIPLLFVPHDPPALASTGRPRRSPY